MSEDSNGVSRAERGAQRLATGGVPVRKFRLGEEPMLDDRDESSPEDRLLELARLSKRAYELSGLQVQSYTRATMPGRLLRGFES